MSAAPLRQQNNEFVVTEKWRHCSKRVTFTGYAQIAVIRSNKCIIIYTYIGALEVCIKPRAARCLPSSFGPSQTSQWLWVTLDFLQVFGMLFFDSDSKEWFGQSVACSRAKIHQKFSKDIDISMRWSILMVDSAASMYRLLFWACRRQNHWSQTRRSNFLPVVREPGYQSDIIYAPRTIKLWLVVVHSGKMLRCT